ncbi:MAG: hypothetical protein IJV35_08210 [Neisseriaceae bacterium]|nr:hypothetical protein [Neisseriaceae bacterium]
MSCRISYTVCDKPPFLHLQLIDYIQNDCSQIPIKSLYLCYNRTLNQADSHKHNETQRYAAQVSYAFDNAKQNTLFTHFQAA